MSDGSDVERCGRCATSTVVDAAGVDADPYAGGHIEVEEDDVRAVSAHVVAAGRVKSWLDAIGRRLTYGR
ncbi:hypothetical protein GCM10009037_18280 [Halarchaeum grantii]|uniref:Uncharacterized protein n=1 Tax=Halarchaeum grantii TaxID=1193105 RepID=A0A830EXQ8_9EURY|nr:hypothetical protein [Halarchaeum grantii]GGL35020.1 hypothetical protein GCM10009037_18280 [Halarchaeum grantii]